MLRLRLLGGFRAYTEAGELAALARQPRRAALLAYLALEREVPRTRIINLHWPDVSSERGRHSLNQGIYYLRRIIGADWVELKGDRCVVAAWVETDVQELERAAERGDHDAVLRLYGGPLLGGTDIAPTADFEMWIDQRRVAIDRLHRRARRYRIAALLADGRTRDALHCAEEWCRLEPLEDEAQHRYIELLAAAGQRAAALRQFTSYSRLLEEHELRPLDETLALIEQLQQGDVGALPDAGNAIPVPGEGPVPGETGGAPREAPVPGETGGAPREGPVPRGTPAIAVTATPAGTARRTGAAALLHSRRGLVAVLGLVFLVNLVETTAETWLESRVPLIAGLRIQFARAAHWFEGYYAFEAHELTNRVAVIGYSTSYFFVFAAMLVGIGIALARRREIGPFRVFATAIALNYLICLPFFLFMPVPERWTYPGSGAVLLSDLWSAHLIGAFRPISGLDNSFPSFHVSLTTVLVLVGFIMRLRYRWSMLFLGCTIIIATFALGIHWLPDLVAGAATGVLAVALALRLNHRLEAGTSAAAVATTSRTRTTAVHAAPITLQPEPR